MKNTEAICKGSIIQIQTFPVPKASGILCIPVTFTIDKRIINAELEMVMPSILYTCWRVQDVSYNVFKRFP